MRGEKGGLTLLLRARGHADGLVAAVGLVRARVELLVAAALERGAEVHERVALDLELAVWVARVGDGRRGDAGERAREGLEVALARGEVGVDGGRGRGESGGHEGGKNEGGLHCWGRWLVFELDRGRWISEEKKKGFNKGVSQRVSRTNRIARKSGQTQRMEGCRSKG